MSSFEQVNWAIIKPNDNQLPRSCHNLSWNHEKYQQYPQDFQVIQDITKSLQLARRITMNTIQLQQEKLELYHQPQDLLVVFVNGVEFVDEILQQTSWNIRNDLHKLAQSFQNTVQNNSEAQSQLTGNTSTLDAEFVNCSRSLFSLADCRRTNILDTIDEQFLTDNCSTLEQSRDIAQKKFEKLKSLMEIILNNIDCSVLISVDTIISGKIMIDSKNVPSEIVQNSFRICEIVNEPTNF